MEKLSLCRTTNDLEQRGKSMGSIYDSPDIYDLLEDENRYLAYKRHWEHLFEGRNIKSMLDISIGSGSVTLPVLDINITLSGSDLSENMLENCSKKYQIKDSNRI